MMHLRLLFPAKIVVAVRTRRCGERTGLTEASRRLTPIPDEPVR